MAAAARAPTSLAIALLTLAVTTASSVVWPAVRCSAFCCEAQPAMPPMPATPKQASATNRWRVMPCPRARCDASRDDRQRRFASAGARAPRELHRLVVPGLHRVEGPARRVLLRLLLVHWRLSHS